jgi:pimeloyl-ACP methyl ester carboxylesterase
MDIDELSVFVPSATTPSGEPVGSDVTLRIRRWAGPGRLAFLLVHGLSADAGAWAGVAEALAEAGHPAYAVDLRGHGRSDAPATGHDTATAVADLAALITALELAPVLVAGHSWGGKVAVRLAAEHPALVAGLALVDGGWPDPAARSGYDDPPQRFYPAVAVPTVLLSAVPIGDPEETASLRERVGRAAAALPQATVREYPGAGPDLHVHHPRLVAADLLTLAKEVA